MIERQVSREVVEDAPNPWRARALLNSIPPYWTPMIELFAKRVGDHRTEEGRALLVSHSPLTYVHRICRPLLIGQGANDPPVARRFPLRYQILLPFAVLSIITIVAVSAIDAYLAMRAIKRQTEKQLREQAAKMSETEKREKETQFRTKVQDYQKRAQEFNQELQRKQKELVDDYMKKIMAATKTVAEKGGFSLVLDKGSEQTMKIVIYNKDAIDLTEQVVKEFDLTNK